MHFVVRLAAEARTQAPARLLPSTQPARGCCRPPACARAAAALHPACARGCPPAAPQRPAAHRQQEGEAHGARRARAWRGVVAALAHDPPRDLGGAAAGGVGGGGVVVGRAACGSVRACGGQRASDTAPRSLGARGAPRHVHPGGVIRQRDVHLAGGGGRRRRRDVDRRRGAAAAMLRASPPAAARRPLGPRACPAPPRARAWRGVQSSCGAWDSVAGGCRRAARPPAAPSASASARALSIPAPPVDCLSTRPQYPVNAGGRGGGAPAAGARSKGGRTQQSRVGRLYDGHDALGDVPSAGGGLTGGDVRWRVPLRG